MAFELDAKLNSFELNGALLVSICLRIKAWIGNDEDSDNGMQNTEHMSLHLWEGMAKKI